MVETVGTFRSATHLLSPMQVKHAKADRKDTDAVKEAVAGKNFDGERETYGSRIILATACQRSHVLPSSAEPLDAVDRVLHVQPLQWCTT